MDREHSKNIALLTALAGIVVLIGFGIVVREVGLEWWHLRKLRAGTPDEQSASANWLAMFASETAMPVLVKVLQDEKREWTRTLRVLLAIGARSKRGSSETLQALKSAGVEVIEAVVKAVDSGERLVVLSAGKDQGVVNGDEFVVFRGGALVCTVKVIKVFPDLCGAEMLDTTSGRETQAGDKAAAIHTN